MIEATRWRALTALLHRPRTPSAVVAVRGGVALTQADFVAHVAAWRDRLAEEPGTRWALHAEDTFDFATALFGAWHAGKTVIVPGDVQEGTVARLRGVADGFLGDLPAALAPPSPASCSPDAAAGGLAQAWPLLDAQATRLVVYTSGTNGEPLAIDKRLAQLDAEVHALETRFGAMCDTGLAPVNLAPESVPAGAAAADWGAGVGIDASTGVARDSPPLIWSTVTHQHIYGLLFRVLWPLAAGRPFVCERLTFNEEIALRIAGPAVLVASPAHLRRLPDAVDWTAARAGLRAVFSSGGALPPEAADATFSLLGTAPVEVYGSSETGGVAWRQRARHGDTWQTLPGVAFRIDDGELSVQSPHLPDAQWWRSADRAAPAGDGMDGFELLGRVDRIVKIEEKRVSLTALEQRLASGADVAEARVVMSMARPAVVAVLTDPGRRRLAREGKSALVASLRASLLAIVDRVALPRRWRFVDALPVNAQGKSTQALLEALFESAPARPTLEWQVREPDHAVAAFELTPDLRVFEGHFPGRAILPGVAQVDWAIVFARRHFVLPPVFRRLDALKFSLPAEPGMRLEIDWRWDAAASTLQFEYRSAAGRHSSGRVVFAQAEPVA